MQMTAGEWAIFLNGELEGNSNVVITHPAKIEEAGEGAISFIANPKYEGFAYTTGASILIVSRDLRLDQPVKAGVIRVDQPYTAFTRVLEKFNNLTMPLEELHPQALLMKQL
jgi:UDP-3-O-[3-hydroxymyristoyl] glucosamine N-acyltransferase